MSLFRKVQAYRVSQFEDMANCKYADCALCGLIFTDFGIFRKMR